MAGIREITLSEAATVAGIVRRGFRDVAEQLNLTVERCPSFPAHCQTDWIEREIAAGSRFFVSEKDGQPFGCVGIKIDGETCWGVRLAVLPEARHAGSGQDLMDFIQDEARRQGFGRVDIAVVAENTRLCEWYLKLGFVDCAIKHFDHLPFTVRYMYRKTAVEVEAEA